MIAMLVLCNIFIANVILTLDNVEIMQSNVFLEGISLEMKIILRGKQAFASN